MIGKVKWFDPLKGFGFIEREDEKDVFLHYKNIVMKGFKELNEGDNVEFDIEDTEKGTVARNVKKIEGAEK